MSSIERGERGEEPIRGSAEDAENAARRVEQRHGGGRFAYPGLKRDLQAELNEAIARTHQGPPSTKPKENGENGTPKENGPAKK